MEATQDCVATASDKDSVEKNIKERKELWKEYFPVGRKIALWVLFFYVILGCLPHYLKRFSLIDEAGTFGDSFGFVNAFFSGFAVAGLLVTIWIQIREFRLAQVERREAIDAQIEIGKQHAKNLEVQKQIAQAYVSNIEIQKQISDQQQTAAIISGIRTWSQMVVEVHDSGFGSMQIGYLRYLKQKSINSLLLRLAMAQSLQPRNKRTGDALLNDHPEYLALEHITSLAVDLAEVAMTGCDRIANGAMEEETREEFKERVESTVLWMTTRGNDIFRNTSDTADMIIVGDLNDMYEEFSNGVNALRNATENLNYLRKPETLQQELRGIATSQRTNIVKYAHALLLPKN